MPHELGSHEPALRYLERSPEQNLMLRRSLSLGRRPGFAVIVDNPAEVRALMLVERPDWKRPGPILTRIQMDATDFRSAVHLLSWLPPVAHVRVCCYRPWLQELIQSVLEPARVVHKVHCMAHRQQFRPSRLQHLVTELAPAQADLRRQAREMGMTHDGDRLFGIVQGGALIACASLARPDTDYVSVGSVYTQESERLHGYGSAVLSAATEAGLQGGKVVTYGLPVEDVPSLHLVAGLGFAPACREWMVEGHPRG